MLKPVGAPNAFESASVKRNCCGGELVSTNRREIQDISTAKVERPEIFTSQK